MLNPQSALSLFHKYSGSFIRLSEEMGNNGHRLKQCRGMEISDMITEVCNCFLHFVLLPGFSLSDDEREDLMRRENLVGSV